MNEKLRKDSADFQEEHFEIDLGDENTFYIADNGNYFGINFGKILGEDSLSIYNNFELFSKRNFKNLAASILSTYEELFLTKDNSLEEDAELIIFNILRSKSEIMVTEKLSYEKFIEYIKNIIYGGDNLLLKIISNFVEENYSISLDKITEATKAKKRKVNVELQFLDSNAKDLLKITYLYRVMIPIISVYFYYNKGSFNSCQPDEYTSPEDIEELEFEDVNSKIFAFLFDIFATKPDALRNKLYRLVYSGVSKTKYSDKRFWRAAKNVAVSPETETLEIYKKVILNAVPKLSIDGNVISFLQSVINNQVNFLFQNKFKYHFTTLGNSESSLSTEDNDDDDNISEIERLEILNSRKNEGSFILRKLNIKDVLEKLPERLNVGITDAEVKEGMKSISRNQIQEFILSLITFKYFQDKDALKYLSFYDYCYVLLICKKYLIQYKFKYLPIILTAKCEKHRERVSISGKKVRPEILNSKKYTELLEKYSSFKEEIEKPFLSFIGTVYSSVFKDEEGCEIFDSSVKVGKIAEEIVDLSKLV